MNSILLIAGLTEEEIEKAIKLSGVTETGISPIVSQQAAILPSSQPPPPGRK